MTKHNIIYLTAALGLSLLTACTSESFSGEDRGAGIPAEITGTIGTAPVIDTKATVGNGDNISYSAFAAPDAIGFFATGGLVAGNMKLTYDNGSFKGNGGSDNLIWTEGTATAYTYFPYSENTGTTTTDAGTNNTYSVSIWREAKSDSDPKWYAGFEDFLAASATNIPNGTLVSFGFRHQFAMLILERGKGFDTQKDDVTVQLNYKLSKKANLVGSGTSFKLQLQTDGSNDGIQKLTGNPGKYKVSTKTDEDGIDCYYIIIPVGDVYNGNAKQSNALTVESVKLKNNADVDMTVPFLPNFPFKANWKYRVIVQMRDNQAVIEPEEIVRWEKENIHIEKPIGIGRAKEFEEWYSTYNSYRGSNTEEDKNSYAGKLAEFGTYKNGKWTFLLLNNIDLTSVSTVGKATTAITTFSDIFDGQGHTITGLSVSGSGNAGFFGTLSGEVKNLKLEDMQVQKSGDTTSDTNFGGIAGKVTSTGKISNCHILGEGSFVFGTGNVGGLAGSLTSGCTIENCTSTATVSGTETGTTGLLVGNTNGGTLTNCTSTGTVITITNTNNK